MIGKKSGILFLLYLLFSLFLPGCAGITSYDDVEAEAQITGDDTKLRKMDALAEEATDYFLQVERCVQSKMVWMCTRAGASNTRTRRKGKAETIDELLRRYRRAKMGNCGCASSGAIRDMMQGRGF